MSCIELNGWPVLKSYTGEALRRVAMPLGGIGTGTISLSGRGGLVDWELMNRPAKGFIPQYGHASHAFHPCFTIRYETPSGQRAARLLEGPLLAGEYEGGSGCEAPNHGLPRFAACTFHAAYPLAQVAFEDDTVIPQVTLQAFNPLIPADAESSGLPVAVMRWLVKNPADESLSVSICASMINFVGRPGNAELPEGASSDQEPFSSDSLQGIRMSATGLDDHAPSTGTFACCTDSDGEITTSTAIAYRKWNVTRLEFWDRLLEHGDVVDTSGEEHSLAGANLCAGVVVPAGETRAVNFYLTWHFPNRRTWTPHDDPSDVIGNYYCTHYTDAVDAAKTIVPRLPELEQKTVRFVDAFCSSDLPAVVKEAALFNISTLRSETCFRTADGHFYAWEGCSNCEGCCYGSCTHVWNYEHAIAFLFGDLARDMRESEFLHATTDVGRMSFRVNLPLAHARDYAVAAADGQMGCIMKLYRDWQLSGDDAWLGKLWPRVRKALEFCWIEGGWDADQDGVMEGCQHNTMDVEYYGPNPQMTIWYLGALRAAEEMANRLGEGTFASTCRALFENGSRAVDEKLFNGEYYEHVIQAPGGPVAEGLRHPSMGAADPSNPDYQLGAGCLVDQLVGQNTAHILGLGYLTDRANVTSTLRSILKYNRLTDFRNHFNPMRDFVLGDESALLMAGYPEGKRPGAPFPYYAEVMTGFEYTAAVHMLYEGMTEEGLQVIADIRDRYDGARRNPFNEAECGHHYGRAMAAWSAVIALTGFQYSAAEDRMSFDAPDGTYFWSTGYAWGTASLRNGEAEKTVLFSR